MDRNCAGLQLLSMMLLSLSARRAWIEIIDDFEPSTTRIVALRKESVDRNSDGVVSGSADYVVALRKESVDRNINSMILTLRFCASLSARRAWIEMIITICTASRRCRRSPQGERG